MNTPALGVTFDVVSSYSYQPYIDVLMALVASRYGWQSASNHDSLLVFAAVPSASVTASNDLPARNTAPPIPGPASPLLVCTVARLNATSHSAESNAALSVMSTRAPVLSVTYVYGLFRAAEKPPAVASTKIVRVPAVSERIFTAPT